MTSTTSTSRIPIAPERPRSTRVAVGLMVAGAVVSALRALVPLIWGDEIKQLALAGAGEQVNNLSQQQIDSIVSASLGGAVAGALGGALLWVWMAWANNGGRRWARIVASVFCGISVVSFLYSLTQPALPIGYVLATALMLIGVAAIIALYRPSSSEYIAASSRAT